jgi:hypothetical protein
MSTETALRYTDAYYDWVDKLYDLMEWTESPDGDVAKTTWKCGDPATQDRLALARRAASLLSADFDMLLAQAREMSGAHCDCEIIFNCDDRPEAPDEDDTTGEQK